MAVGSIRKTFMYSVFILSIIVTTSVGAQQLCQLDHKNATAIASDGTKFKSKAGWNFSRQQCEAHERAYRVSQKCPSGSGTIANGVITCDKEAIGEKKEDDPIVQKVLKYCRAQGFESSQCELFKKNKEKAYGFYKRNICLFEMNNPECDGPPPGYESEEKHSKKYDKKESRSYSGSEQKEDDDSESGKAFKELDEETAERD